MSSTTSIQDAAAAQATVQGEQGSVLKVRFDYQPAARIVAVSYRLRNTADAPLAVFDRGNFHAVDTGRQKAGEVGIPTEKTEGEDVELMHGVLPLRRPSPTVPPTPIALRLEPGKEVSARFEYALKGTLAPKRLRWCVGVMRFNETDFDQPHTASQGQLWRASFAVVGKQQMLCTPWFDVAANRFEA